MTKAAEGQILSLEEALALEDANGKPIKFELQPTGAYAAKGPSSQSKDDSGKEIAGYTYSYFLEPQGTKVRVSVVKQKNDLVENKRIAEQASFDKKAEDQANKEADKRDKADRRRY